MRMESYARAGWLWAVGWLRLVAAGWLRGWLELARLFGEADKAL